MEGETVCGTLDAVVKAGGETSTQSDLAVSDGKVTVTNEDLKYAISNVRFYCEASDDMSVGNSDQEEGSSDNAGEDRGRGHANDQDEDHDRGHGNNEGTDEDNPGNGADKSDNGKSGRQGR